MRDIFAFVFRPNTDTGAERYRKVMLSAAAAALTKVISIATALVSVPLTLGYLGNERYGLWLTFSSIIAMLSFADFGLGNGVLSEISSSNATDKNAHVREVISTAFIVLASISVVLFLVFCLIFPLLDLSKMLKLKTDTAKQEVAPAFFCIFSIFCLNLVLGIVGKVQSALQEGFRLSLWQCAGAIFGLVGVIVAIKMELGLVYLIGALAGIPSLFLLFNGVHYFLIKRPEILPKQPHFSVSIAKRIFSFGIMFFVLQVVASLTFASDGFIIAGTLGAAAVAAYAVPEKLFSLITAAVMMAAQPLWPAYGEAFAKGDRAWAMKALNRSSFYAAMLAIVAGCFLVIFGKELIHFWTNGKVAAPTSLLVGLAVWKLVEVTGVTYASFLNGAKIIRPQVLFAILTAALVFPAKWFYVSNYGSAAIPYVVAVIYTSTCLVPIIWLARKWRTG